MRLMNSASAPKIKDGFVGFGVERHTPEYSLILYTDSYVWWLFGDEMRLMYFGLAMFPNVEIDIIMWRITK